MRLCLRLKINSKMQTKITGRSSVFHSVSTQNPALPDIDKTGIIILGEGSFAVIPSPPFGRKPQTIRFCFKRNSEEDSPNQKPLMPRKSV